MPCVDARQRTRVTMAAQVATPTVLCAILGCRRRFDLTDQLVGDARRGREEGLKAVLNHTGPGLPDSWQIDPQR